MSIIFLKSKWLHNNIKPSRWVRAPHSFSPNSPGVQNSQLTFYGVAHENKFTGSIAKELGWLLNWKCLNLNSSQLSGSILKELGSL